MSFVINWFKVHLLIDNLKKFKFMDLGGKNVFNINAKLRTLSFFPKIK